MLLFFNNITAKSLKLCVSLKYHIYQRLRTCALMAAVIVYMRTMRLLGRVHAMIVTSEFRFNNLGIRKEGTGERGQEVKSYRKGLFYFK